MNNGCYIGRLTREIELRRTNGGKAVCSFTLAVDRPGTKDVTDFIDFVVYGQGAEYLSKYASKGAKISATGALTSRKWEDRNGNKRTNWEISCNSVSIEDSKKSDHTGFVPNDKVPNNFAVMEEDDEQLPF